MKVFIDDGLQLARGTGIGKYTKGLYDAFKNRSDIEVELANWRPIGKSEITKRARYLKHINSNEYIEELENYDIVIYTNYVMPVRKINAKTVVVVHDLAAFDVPETLRMPYRYYNRAAINYSVRHADTILTVSNTMAKEIVKRYPFAMDKVCWSWPGLLPHVNLMDRPGEFDNTVLKQRGKNPFFLVVCTVEKRKNIEFVMAAFDEMKQRTPEAEKYWLAIAGRPGYGYEHIIDMANSLKFGKDIVFSGYVSDVDCGRLYNRASAFVFPTRYEGFGFPQIECMSCHLPLLLSDIEINREVSRAYGTYFNLDTPHSLSKAMALCVKDGCDRAELGRMADKYMKDYSWNRVVQLCLDRSA